MLLQNLQKAFRANNRSLLAKDESSGPFVATCSLVGKNNEKNNKKKKKKNKNKNNLKMVLVLCSHTFCLQFQSSLKKLVYEGF